MKPFFHLATRCHGDLEAGSQGNRIQGLQDDANRMTSDDRGNPHLPLQQIDDLWMRDRWFDAIKYQRARNAVGASAWPKNTWTTSAAQLAGFARAAGYPESTHGGHRQRQKDDAVRRLFDQAVFERRAKRVVKFEV
jgi:hypothetical protein